MNACHSCLYCQIDKWKFFLEPVPLLWSVLSWVQTSPLHTPFSFSQGLVVVTIGQLPVFPIWPTGGHACWPLLACLKLWPPPLIPTPGMRKHKFLKVIVSFRNVFVHWNLHLKTHSKKFGGKKKNKSHIFQDPRSTILFKCKQYIKSKKLHRKCLKSTKTKRPRLQAT